MSDDVTLLVHSIAELDWRKQEMDIAKINYHEATKELPKGTFLALNSFEAGCVLGALMKAGYSWNEPGFLRIWRQLEAYHQRCYEG